MPVGDQALMDGTTLCPHCETRFKITGTQLTAHQGMVRCGHCLQIFDARTSFIPDPPNSQLELPIVDEATAATVQSLPAEHDTLNNPPPAEENIQVETISAVMATPGNDEAVAEGSTPDSPLSTGSAADGLAHAETPDLGETTATGKPQSSHAVSPRPLTLAEQITIVHDDGDSMPRPKPRNWPWVMASLLLLLALIAQAAYFFRIDLAARLPGLKPALVEYCKLLNCSIPLPRHVDSMSIESSSLEADPAHENQITLNALLRNRASYTQAFPHLELTLNDTQDQPLARRTFRPADYLPPVENEKNGLLPNHELSISLRLDTTKLKPTGYRLVLYYPG